MTDRPIEILAPAGSYECFQAAIAAGADAVYAGGSRFGARAYADNFTEEELIRAIEEAHLFGKKLYLTVNTLLKDTEIEELYAYLSPLYEKGLDAVIVQDTGVLEYIRTNFPGLDIHASTQMTITGYPGAAFFEKAGAVRVVPARELSLSGNPGDPQAYGSGDRVLCTRSSLLLLFRPVSAKQCNRRQKREQRAVRPAVQTSLDSRRTAEILSEPERYLYAGSDPGSCRSRRWIPLKLKDG